MAAAMLSLMVAGGLLTLMASDDDWNPYRPLDPEAHPNPVTPFKLTRAAASGPACKAALSRLAGTGFDALPDRTDDVQCGIENRLRQTSLSGTSVRAVETRCETALRLAMWTRHSLQPAAERHLGSAIAEIRHFDSFSCRRIRTADGEGRAMSAHATARAIDVEGVRLSDGRVLKLLESWNGSAAERTFWREVRDGACRYFRTVLSPQYNALHADHFHLSQERWSACR